MKPGARLVLSRESAECPRIFRLRGYVLSPTRAQLVWDAQGEANLYHVHVNGQYVTSFDGDMTTGFVKLNASDSTHNVVLYAYGNEGKNASEPLVLNGVSSGT